MDVWMDVGESRFNVGVDFGRMIFLVGA